MWTLEAEKYNVIKNIEYVKNLYDLQVYKVKNEKYIEDLLLKDYVRAIKENVSRYDFVDFNAAQKEVKEKAKNKRKNIEFLRNLMIDDFFNNDDNFKITSMMSCGYDNYAWAIEFAGYEKVIRINIPIVKNLTTKNIDYASQGMFCFLVRESNSCWNTLKQSYKIKDIADYIYEYFSLDELKEEE